MLPDTEAAHRLRRVLAGSRATGEGRRTVHARTGFAMTSTDGRATFTQTANVCQSCGDSVQQYDGRYEHVYTEPRDHPAEAISRARFSELIAERKAGR